MDFNWEKLRNLLDKISRYALGKLRPASIDTLKKLSKSLTRYMSELQEWHIYKTAGAYQDMVARKLKECKDAKLKLDSLLSWYDETSGNSKSARWKRNFLETGAGKDEEKIKNWEKKMKLLKKNISGDEAEQMDIQSMLRQLACDEIVSYHAYITASKNIRGQNWLDVKQEFEQHAKTELEHYESILDRLYQLGQPVHAVFNTVQERAGYYWDMDTEDPKEACEIAKKAEDAAVEGYRKLLIAIADLPLEERDFGTQRLAKKHLEAEQDHVQDMIHLLEEFK